MVFSSFVFLFVFFPAVFLVYYALPKKFRNAFLLLSDLVFYGWGEPVLISLMLVSILFNYVVGLLLEKFDGADKKRKAVLIISLVVDLGLLAFFKYADFTVRNLNALLPAANLAPPHIPLPVGISFYTFQIMSYTIDVFRRETKAQRSIIAFGAYGSLFPQLIAGPIVRYRDVDDQLQSRRENLPQIAQGIQLFLLGLAKKVLLANPMGTLWDELRAMPDGGAVAAWCGVIAFSLQIYFDFSGYSDVARVCGFLFGFSFLQTSDSPYVSKSITEFWRRWHISLGTWFREYVYIPLGGNRRGKARQLVNILIVWMLTGLWHGASWNFVLWGLYFGVLLIVEKLFLLKLLQKIPAVFSHLYALLFIALGWVLFAFDDGAGVVRQRELHGGGAEIDADKIHGIHLLLLSSFIIVKNAPVCKRKDEKSRSEERLFLLLLRHDGQPVEKQDVKRLDDSDQPFEHLFRLFSSFHRLGRGGEGIARADRVLEVQHFKEAVVRRVHAPQSLVLFEHRLARLGAVVAPQFPRQADPRGLVFHAADLDLRVREHLFEAGFGVVGAEIDFALLFRRRAEGAHARAAGVVDGGDVKHAGAAKGFKDRVHLISLLFI